MNEINYHRYFDWAATAPFDTQVLQESLEESFKTWGNPSSIYKLGTDSKNTLNEARNIIAQTLEVDSKNLFFTSGGTESDQIPLLSILNRPAESASILVSSIEHPALREQCKILSRLGYKVIQIPSDTSGIIQPETVASLITNDTLFIAVMAVNNETGAIQPVKEIAEKIKETTRMQRFALINQIASMRSSYSNKTLIQ